jgi:hypothetical protein
MDSDIGGWLWLMIDVIFVAALALALVYGTIRWRTRRRNRDVEKAVGQAIKRMYERESEDEQRLDVPSALAFRAMAMVRYNARWIVGAFVAAAVIGGVAFYAMSNRRQTPAAIPDANTGQSAPAPATPPTATNR